MWLVRDYDGSLYLYDRKPRKPSPVEVCGPPMWTPTSHVFRHRIDSDEYPHLTFDSNPMEIDDETATKLLKMEIK